MFARELIHEIDETLRLLENNASNQAETELTNSSESLQQSSLISQLLYLDKLLTEKPGELKVQNRQSARYKIYEKLSRLRTLDKELDLDTDLPLDLVVRTKVPSKRS